MKLKLKKSSIIVLATLMLSLTVVYAAWSYSAGITSRERAGVVKITVTGDNFSVGNLVPGDRIARIVTITNTGTVSGYLTLNVDLIDDPDGISKYLEVIYFGKDTKVAGGPWWYTTEEVTWCDYPSPAIDRAFTGEDNMIQAVKTKWLTYSGYQVDEFEDYISLYDLVNILGKLGSTGPEPSEYHQVYLKLQLHEDTPESLMGAVLDWKLGFTLNQRAGTER